MRAADIELLVTLGALTAHPDGDRVVVAAAHPHLASDAVVGQLWTVPLDGSGARRLTRGTRDSAPAFSPDGSVLAFLRSAPGSAPQLTVMAAGGGEPTTLTDQKLGVSEFRFTGDGAGIVYTARVAEQGRYGTVEGIAANAEPARRITTVKYKSNGLGYTGDRRSQLFVVDVPSLDAEPRYEPVATSDGEKAEAPLVPESRQLTFDDADSVSPRILGDRVLFLSARHDSRDRDLRSQLWSIPLVGGAVRAESALGALSILDAEVAPDGTILAIAQDVGDTGIDFVARNASLYRIDAESAEQLTPLEHDLGDIYSGIRFRGENALVLDRTHGRRQLLEVTSAGDITTLTNGDVEIESALAVGDGVVVTLSAPDTFGDVAVIEESGVRRLSDFSRHLIASGIRPPAELTITGRDGSEVHGWVARPEGEGPFPTLLMIHGGPFAAYSVHVFDEVQVLVDAGYAVVFCNPRGSAGYGEAHGRSIRQAMGTLDMHDVLDFLDGALASDATLDADRLGILGGSYGGYLTAWVIAHDHRFRTAIVERGYLDPEAFVGSSDIGWFFGQEYTGTDHNLIRTQSPQAVVDQVRTPTLVIHSENDLRCPLGQAETYYASLALNGVETELLVFPGEDHELSRSGRPRHRVQRFDAILEWFARYL